MEDWDYIKKLSKMKTSEDIEKFEDALSELAIKKDPGDLNNLLDLFYDDCEHPEVMYSLVHLVEAYPDDFYVKTIISRIDKDIERVPFWFYGLISAIFNNENCLNIFNKNSNIIQNKSIIKIVEFMEKEMPHHYEIIQNLKNKIK